MTFNLTPGSRRLAKTLAAQAIGPFSTWRGPLVLGYHRVVEDFNVDPASAMPAMLVSRGMFERQLDYLGRHYRFVGLDDLLDSPAAMGAGGRPPAAVTFDDGYRDVYEHAFPILRRKGIPAAVFVVTSHVGTDEPLLHDRVYWLLARELPRWGEHGIYVLLEWLRELGVDVRTVAAIRRASRHPGLLLRALVTRLTRTQLAEVHNRLLTALGLSGPMPPGWQALTWEMAEDMVRAGITIGSHTCTHVRMTNETVERQREEAVASRQTIERRLGVRVRHFAYPDGAFNSAVVDQVEAAGYACAYTTCRHVDPHRPLLTVPRLLLWEQSSLDAFGRLSPNLLRCQSSGWWTGAPSCSRLAHA